MEPPSPPILRATVSAALKAEDGLPPDERRPPLLHTQSFVTAGHIGTTKQSASILRATLHGDPSDVQFSLFCHLGNEKQLRQVRGGANWRQDLATSRILAAQSFFRSRPIWMLALLALLRL